MKKGFMILGLVVIVAMLLTLISPALANSSGGFQPGDANKDGDINMGDIIYTETMILGLAPHSCTADANQDGEVNMGDIIVLEHIILGH